MPTITLRTATVEVNRYVFSTFTDGHTNLYDPLWPEQERDAAKRDAYLQVVDWAGYGNDYRRYGIEHELTHHLIADALGWRWSWALHDPPHPEPWPEHIAWEEHLVNAAQRFFRTLTPDPDGAFQAAFRGRGTEIGYQFHRTMAQI